jgi:hypothetical protein
LVIQYVKIDFLEKNLDGVDDPDIPTSEIVNILDRAALSAKIF